MDNNSKSHVSQISQLSIILTSDLFEEFFYDDGGPYRPPRSTYVRRKSKDNFYYCTLHLNIQNIYLETIKHHIKYKDPESHKSEMLAVLINRSIMMDS
jgi:hypothetical protein